MRLLMPSPDESMKLSTNLRGPSCPSANCSNERGIMNTKMITPSRLDPAFIRNAPPCGNLIPPSKQLRNGWGRGDFRSFANVPMIFGQEVDNFSQKAVGNDPPLAKIRN